MEVLLHAGRQSSGWRSRQMHQAVLSACGLTAEAYTLGQLRYDWRKMKAHRLVERLDHSYCYRLTRKGIGGAVIFLLFHKRLRGPLADSLFGRKPSSPSPLPTKIATAYRSADASIQHLVAALAA